MKVCKVLVPLCHFLSGSTLSLQTLLLDSPQGHFHDPLEEGKRVQFGAQMCLTLVSTAISLFWVVVKMNPLLLKSVKQRACHGASTQYFSSVPFLSYPPASILDSAICIIPRKSFNFWELDYFNLVFELVRYFNIQNDGCPNSLAPQFFIISYFNYLHFEQLQSLQDLELWLFLWQFPCGLQPPFHNPRFIELYLWRCLLFFMKTYTRKNRTRTQLRVGVLNHPFETLIPNYARTSQNGMKWLTLLWGPVKPWKFHLSSSAMWWPSRPSGLQTPTRIGRGLWRFWNWPMNQRAKQRTLNGWHMFNVWILITSYVKYIYIF